MLSGVFCYTGYLGGSARNLRTPGLSTVLLTYLSLCTRSFQSSILARAQGSGGRDVSGQGGIPLGQGGGLAVSVTFVFCFLSVFLRFFFRSVCVFRAVPNVLSRVLRRLFSTTG